jgi:putative colanic acid biosynthesis glycosyltransferase
MPPLISIIITVLNGSSTVDACLKSIKGQTFTDYELIIIEGGSSDGSLERIGQYAFPRGHVHIAPGVGLYAGLNIGISRATGEWLYFMGIDDVLYDAHVLQTFADAVRRRQPNTQVLVGSVQYKSRNTLHVPKLGSPARLHYQVHHQGMLYQRGLFETDRYDETMQIAADYAFNLRLVLSGVRHETVDATICTFSETGVSSTLPWRAYVEMQHAHCQAFSGLKQTGIHVYFFVRRWLGWLLRRYHFYKTIATLKRITD